MYKSPFSIDISFFCGAAVRPPNECDLRRVYHLHKMNLSYVVYEIPLVPLIQNRPEAFM